MTNLPKFTLKHNKSDDGWDLKNAAGKVVEKYETKADATAGGVLESAVGAKGGSVQIHKVKGPIQEERTYPRSRDPKKSKG